MSHKEKQMQTSACDFKCSLFVHLTTLIFSMFVRTACDQDQNQSAEPRLFINWL